MRIIEPRKPAKSKRKLRQWSLLMIIIGLAITGATYYLSRPSGSDQSNNTVQANIEYQSPDPATLNPNTAKFKVFSPDEFLELYESIAYPNTQYSSVPPEITGNTKADERIRTIALSRGYALRAVPVAAITKTEEPRVSNDDLLQEKAFTAWQSLKKAAKADGIPLQFNSGYRSVEMQRTLFMQRLAATGVTSQQIAAGQGDNQIVAVLRSAALPGYSRHHTGYTIDLVCANGTQSFEVTTCFKWLSDNNYLNAKKHGWIPSYPEGVDKQGPEPEAWEYVWVGLGPLVED